MPNQTILKPDFLIKDEQALRSLFPATHELAKKKCQCQLDKHTIEFIERSPFMCMGTQSKDGSADVSPRGDPRGFVKILDNRTLLIPDRPGNNRLDTQSNILNNAAVGLLFMIPGFEETVRVNGTAQITTDPDLLTTMKINDRLPLVAIVVSIDEVFMHCAKAFRRSKLWDPSQIQDRSEMPSLPKMVLEQISNNPPGPDEMKKIDADLEDEYQRTMY